MKFWQEKQHAVRSSNLFPYFDQGTILNYDGTFFSITNKWSQISLINTCKTTHALKIVGIGKQKKMQRHKKCNATGYNLELAKPGICYFVQCSAGSGSSIKTNVSRLVMANYLSLHIRIHCVLLSRASCAYWMVTQW